MHDGRAWPCLRGLRGCVGGGAPKCSSRPKKKAPAVSRGAYKLTLQLVACDLSSILTETNAILWNPPTLLLLSDAGLAARFFASINQFNQFRQSVCNLLHFVLGLAVLSS